MASINQQGNYMVKYDLDRMQTNTARMQNAMPRSQPLPEWAKSKLTQARSHVANVADYQQSKPMGLTANEKQTLTKISDELNGASKMHKGQAQRIRNLGLNGSGLGATNPLSRTPEPVIKFLQLLGIGIVGTFVGAIPMAMLSEPIAKDIQRKLNKGPGRFGKRKIPMDKHGIARYTAMVFDAAAANPFKTAAYWAGGTSILVGATKKPQPNPTQMAVGAGLMAFSAMIAAPSPAAIKERFKLANFEFDVGDAFSEIDAITGNSSWRWPDDDGLMGIPRKIAETTRRQVIRGDMSSIELEGDE